MTEDKNRMITGTPVHKRANEGQDSPSFCNETKTHQVPSSLSLSRTNDGEKTESDSSSTDCGGVIRVPSGSGFRIMTPFPWRLHEILEDIEKKGMDWIVGWTSDGKAFQVLDQERFEGTILPMYFRHSRYKSFQVSIYTFSCHCDGYKVSKAPGPCSVNCISTGSGHCNITPRQRVLTITPASDGKIERCARRSCGLSLRAIRQRQKRNEVQAAS